MKELLIYRDHDGTWVASYDKIPGYKARGDTQQEAVENIKRAIRLYFPCGPCKGESDG